MYAFDTDCVYACVLDTTTMRTVLRPHPDKPLTIIIATHSAQTRGLFLCFPCSTPLTNTHYRYNTVRERGRWPSKWGREVTLERPTSTTPTHTHTPTASTRSTRPQPLPSSLSEYVYLVCEIDICTKICERSFAKCRRILMYTIVHSSYCLCW